MANNIDKETLYKAAMAAAAATGDYKILDQTGLKYFRQQLDKRYINAGVKGQANGVASLDGNGKVPANQMPNGWDDIQDVEVLPIDNIDSSVLYYVKTGGTGDDADKDGNIVKGTANHWYRYVLNSEPVEGQPAGYWADISEADTAKKAVADAQGNIINTTYIKIADADNKYAQKTDIKTYTAGNNIEISAQNVIAVKAGVYASADSLDGKVDKVDGKGLSTNDFTNDYKTKVDGLKNYTAGENITIGDDGTISATVPDVPNVRAMTNAEIDAAFTD